MTTLHAITSELGDFENRLDIEQLAWLSKQVGPDHPFSRRIVWEILEERLPKAALARVRFQVGEIMPDTWTGWHVHNGPGYHLVLQGVMGLERSMAEPDRHSSAVFQYVDEVPAGQACTEPIGIPHRAGNLSKTTALLAITFHTVDADRHHIVPVFGEPSGSVEPM